MYLDNPFLLNKHSNRINAHRALVSEETAMEKKGLCLFMDTMIGEKKPLSTDIGLEIQLEFPLHRIPDGFGLEWTSKPLCDDLSPVKHSPGFLHSMGIPIVCTLLLRHSLSAGVKVFINTQCSNSKGRSSAATAVVPFHTGKGASELAFTKSCHGDRWQENLCSIYTETGGFLPSCFQ